MAATQSPRELTYEEMLEAEESRLLERFQLVIRFYIAPIAEAWALKLKTAVWIPSDPALNVQGIFSRVGFPKATKHFAIKALNSTRHREKNDLFLLKPALRAALEAFAKKSGNDFIANEIVNFLY